MLSCRLGLPRMDLCWRSCPRPAGQSSRSVGWSTRLFRALLSVHSVQPVPNRHKVLLLLSRYFAPAVHSQGRLTRQAVTKLIQTFVPKHLHFPSKHLELVGVASCCHHFAVLVKQQNAIVAPYFLATARTGATSFSVDSYAL